MNPTMSSIEVILLQDLAKCAATRPEDADALGRLEQRGYSARSARDWMITERGRQALACWQDCLETPRPAAGSPPCASAPTRSAVHGAAARSGVNLPVPALPRISGRSAPPSGMR